MGKVARKLESMRNNPRADWVMSDLMTIADAHGISYRKGSGSHVTFSHPKVTKILTVPARRPIKAPYIRDFVALVDEILGD
jgi:predicted RNA binding protein YcfA (HicA-like mRNA interferase family)